MLLSRRRADCEMRCALAALENITNTQANLNFTAITGLLTSDTSPVSSRPKLLALVGAHSLELTSDKQSRPTLPEGKNAKPNMVIAALTISIMTDFIAERCRVRSAA